jgi:hypothetical protein
MITHDTDHEELKVSLKKLVTNELKLAASPPRRKPMKWASGPAELEEKDATLYYTMLQVTPAGKKARRYMVGTALAYSVKKNLVADDVVTRMNAMSLDDVKEIIAWIVVAEKKSAAEEKRPALKWSFGDRLLTDDDAHALFNELNTGGTERVDLSDFIDDARLDTVARVIAYGLENDLVGGIQVEAMGKDALENVESMIQDIYAYDKEIAEAEGKECPRFEITAIGVLVSFLKDNCDNADVVWGVVTAMISLLEDETIALKLQEQQGLPVLLNCMRIHSASDKVVEVVLVLLDSLSSLEGIKAELSQNALGTIPMIQWAIDEYPKKYKPAKIWTFFTRAIEAQTEKACYSNQTYSSSRGENGRQSSWPV